MWGGITAGASTVALASKGVYINKIGRLKPSNKPGKGYMGVRYGTKRSSNKFAYKSIELHSPHKGGPHQIWHWQRNKWSYIKKENLKKFGRYLLKPSVGIFVEGEYDEI